MAGKKISFFGGLIIIFAFLSPLEAFLTGQAGSLLKFYAIGCIGLFSIQILLRGFIRINTPSQIILFLLLTIMFLSVFWSSQMVRGIDYIQAIGLQIVFILMTTQIDYTAHDKECILIGYVLGCVILGGFVLSNIGQVATKGGRVSASTIEGVLDPNNVAAYLVAAVAVLLSYKFEKKTWSMIKLLFELILIIAILMTASRGAFLSLILFVLYDSLMQKNIRDTSKKILIIVSVTCIIVWLTNKIFGDNNPISFLIHRFTSDTMGSSRLFLWESALNAIIKKPLWGYGIGSSAYIVSAGNLGSHNTYLTIWLESGIVAITLLITFYISVWKHKLKGNFNSAVFGALFVSLVTSFFFDAYNKKIFWLPILLCMISITSRDKSTKNTNNIKRVSRGNTR